ncbi:MAG: leucine-rich repeat protein [Bacteroidales bacterium]|nr:leucine-rich repeat protein [Bacteroidales bacterium]
MRKSYLFALLAAVCCQPIYAASDASDGMKVVDIVVSPGELSSLIDNIGSGISTLRLSGAADVRDFRYLSVSLPSGVQKLDLSELTVEAYVYLRPQSDGRTCFYANELPAWSLFSLPVKELILPRSLVSIGEGAMSASSIEKIALPEGIEAVGDYAFYGCSALKDVILPSTLNTLGRSSFSGCVSLAGISLESTKITHLPDYCFADDTLFSSVTFPTSLHSLGVEVFRNTAIKELSIPSVSAYDDYALAGMKTLTDLSLSEEATFGKGTLMGDVALATLNGFPVVVPSLFAAGCESLDIDMKSDDVEAIGSFAFAGTAPENLRFNSLRMVEEGAFADIGALNRIDMHLLDKEIPEVHPEAFAGVDTASVMLIVNDGSEALWRVHDTWGRFNIIPVSQAGVEENMTDSRDILIYPDGDHLRVYCDEGLSAIAIYAPDGRVLLEQKLDGTSAEIDIARFSTSSVAADACIIISVRGGKNIKVLKLKMK